MDRFIVGILGIEINPRISLKSNMDRFIGS